MPSPIFIDAMETRYLIWTREGTPRVGGAAASALAASRRAKQDRAVHAVNGEMMGSG